MKKNEKGLNPANDFSKAELKNGDGDGNGNQSDNFPVVAVGASAGGLEALEKFFVKVPPEPGMAFVVIQHLDSTKNNMLATLLKRFTRLNVLDAGDGIAVKANQVYIAPGDNNLVLQNGSLKFVEIKDKNVLRLPIDHFLRSLAREKQEKSIAVILSGAGSDGTNGIKLVKESGGMVMVQDPDTAQFSGMPKSAINTGLADYILNPGKMPEKIYDYIDGVLYKDKLYKSDDYIFLEKVFVLLHNQTGNDFSNYKKNTILRRIKRRMVINKINEYAPYLRLLQQNPLETETLFKELLIGVTTFFRDPEAFDILKTKVLPVLLTGKQTNEPLRVWVAGCSTGEEAYSLAIILKECMAEIKQTYNIQIFATDLDHEAIETARVGIYPENIISDVSGERLKRFFVKKDSHYQVRKEIREMIIFAQQNLIKDPPFSKLDIITCRNLLIYLDAAIQKKLLPLFHYRLNNDGILFLGTSETVGEFTSIFTPVDRKWKIFRKKNVSNHSLSITDFSLFSFNRGRHETKLSPMPEIRKFSIRERTEKILLERYAPCCVIINEKYEIRYFHGRTTKYLEPSIGEASLNILDMARQGLKRQLSSGIRKAVSQKQEVIYKNLRVKVNDNGNYQPFNLIIRPITEPEPLQGLVMIIFEEIAPDEYNNQEKDPYPLDKEQNFYLMELEHELHTTKEYLQTTVEELETSNEELKSTNEELQSSNEELQSTNEELETSKEELQAVNEELITLNSELQYKIDELSESNNDLFNLLAITNTATMFLDTNLCIKRFTPSISKIFNVLTGDIGRPISHITSNLVYGDFIKEIENVLDTLIIKEVDVLNKDGEYYRMKIIPYRTNENVIDGTIISFINITPIKETGKKLKSLIELVDRSPGMLMITDEKGNIEYVNSKFETFTGYSPADLDGKNFSLLKAEETDPHVFLDIMKALKSGKEWSGEFINRKKNGELYYEANFIYPVKFNKGKTHFVAIKEDISERRVIRDELKKILEKL
jgi:two-component system CheB/CheR fusion protein